MGKHRFGPAGFPVVLIALQAGLSSCGGARGPGDSAGALEQAVITAGDCAADEEDVCKDIKLQDVIDGCYHPVGENKRPDLICTRQCVKKNAPAAEKKCNIIVTGATQDQCPPIPGCCLRLSHPEDDMSTERQICELADSGPNCPTKGKGQCDKTDCGAKVDGKVNWTCHSLGGAWCNCNGLGGRGANFIGTRCPRDKDNKSCAGLAGCCLSIESEGCRDPVPLCLECCCRGGNTDPEVFCAALCLLNPGAYLQGTKWNSSCHEHHDYATCLKNPITIGGNANQCSGIFPKPPANEAGAGVTCKPAPPVAAVDARQCPGAPDSTKMGDQRLVCDCPDLPYCGDYYTPCCAETWGGVTDGCGPCQVCKKNYGDPKGKGMCMPIETDKPDPRCVSAADDLHQSCIEVTYPIRLGWRCFLPPGCEKNDKYPNPAIITCKVPCAIKEPKDKCPDSEEWVYEKGKKPVLKGKKCCEPDKVGMCAPGGGGDVAALVAAPRIGGDEVIGDPVVDAGVGPDCSGGIPVPPSCHDGVCQVDEFGAPLPGECPDDCAEPDAGVPLPDDLGLAVDAVVAQPEVDAVVAQPRIDAMVALPNAEVRAF